MRVCVCVLRVRVQVKALARLSLKDPEYVAVHEKAKYATPKKLVRPRPAVSQQGVGRYCLARCVLCRLHRV